VEAICLALRGCSSLRHIGMLESCVNLKTDRTQKYFEYA
jgi:hypothetical protein